MIIAVYAKCNVADVNIDKFLELTKELVAKTRCEAGCLSYELVRSVENQNIFAFIEKWEDNPALELHMNTPHFTTIVPQIGELLDGKMEIAVHEVIV